MCARGRAGATIVERSGLPIGTPSSSKASLSKSELATQDSSAQLSIIAFISAHESRTVGLYTQWGRRYGFSKGEDGAEGDVLGFLLPGTAAAYGRWRLRGDVPFWLLIVGGESSKRRSGESLKEVVNLLLCDGPQSSRRFVKALLVFGQGGTSVAGGNAVEGVQSQISVVLILGSIVGPHLHCCHCSHHFISRHIFGGVVEVRTDASVGGDEGDRQVVEGSPEGVVDGVVRGESCVAGVGLNWVRRRNSGATEWVGE